MNSKLKTLMVFAGVALLAVPALYAQGRGGGRGGGGGFGGGRGSFGGGSFGGRPAFGGARPTAFSARSSSIGARPSAFSRQGVSGGRFTNSRPSRGGYYNRGGYYRGGGNYGRGGRGYGRYYYLGGIPYFYPFYGFGYGGFGYDYGGFYGDGFYGNGYGYADGTYTGQIASNRDDDNDDDDDDNRAKAPAGVGPSLPSAVQRQLAKRGYYKGSVDGQFGPASRGALSRFQKSQGIKQTGRIDEDSLEALGFTDQR